MGSAGGGGENDVIAIAGVSSLDAADAVGERVHTRIASSGTGEYESGVTEPSARGLGDGVSSVKHDRECVEGGGSIELITCRSCMCACCMPAGAVMPEQYSPFAPVEARRMLRSGTLPWKRSLLAVVTSRVTVCASELMGPEKQRTRARTVMGWPNFGSITKAYTRSSISISRVGEGL